MIPILYEKSETHFTTNGIGRLVDCIRCEVTEERNGVFECEFEYPVNGRHYADITLGRVIFCTHDDSRTGQPFDIYKKTAAIDGIVTFYASHISYRLSNITVRSFSATTCAKALKAIVDNSVVDNPFTLQTDKTLSLFYNNTKPMRAKELLAGTAGSILDIYGPGEYKYDKYTVTFYLNRGTDTDVEIRYGKNLSDLTDDIDYTNTYNAVVPYWRNPETGEYLVLPEYVVFAGNATSTMEPWQDELFNVMTDHNGTQLDFVYSEVKSVPLDLSEYWTEETPTVEQLRLRAMQVLNSSEAWLPNENINIDFVQLWQTPEYANIAPLQRVKLCDTVKVIHPHLGINVRIKVIKTVYDVLLDRYSSMELGKPQATLLDMVTQTALTQARLEFVTESEVMTTVERVTQGMSGALGGYVVTIYNEDNHPMQTLWMDSPSIQTAVNIIKIDKDGIGFSNSGYGGPYLNAWTIDGTFNADFIRAGMLSADLIKTGILQSFDGSTKFNLDTGYYGSANDKVGVYLKDGRIRFRDKTEDPWGEVASTDIMRIYPTIMDSNPVVIEDDSGIRMLYRRAGVIYIPREDDCFILSGRTSFANNDAIFKVVPDVARRSDASCFNFAGRLNMMYGAIIQKGLRVNTGNLNVDNDLRVMTNARIDGTLTAYGNTSLGGTLSVSDNTHFNKKVYVDAGGLEVTGATKLNNALTVSGASTLNGAVTFNNDVTIAANKTLTINGTLNYAMGGDLAVPGLRLMQQTSGSTNHVKMYLDNSRYFRLDPDGNASYYYYGHEDNSSPKAHFFYDEIYAYGDITAYQSKFIGNTCSVSHVRSSYEIEAGTYVYADNYVKADVYVWAGNYMSALQYQTRSDERLKDFREWDNRLDSILDNIEPRPFTWKDSKDGRVFLGVSAQKTQKAIEDSGAELGTVMESETDGYLTVNYNDLTMLMLHRIKEQEKRIATLEARLEALERMILNANT